MILIEKLQKYQPYHQTRLTGEETLPSNQKQILEAKLTYPPLGKAFEKKI